MFEWGRSAPLASVRWPDTNMTEVPPSPPLSVYIEHTQYSPLQLGFTAVNIDRKTECGLCSLLSKVTHMSHHHFSTLEKVQRLKRVRTATVVQNIMLNVASKGERKLENYVQGDCWAKQLI